MLEMRDRWMYIAWALVGAMLVYIAFHVVNLANVSSIADVMRGDIAQPDGWALVGVPLLLGLAYLVIGLAGMRRPAPRGRRRWLAMGSIVIGAALLLVSPFGMLAVVAGGVFLLAMGFEDLQQIIARRIGRG